ncbi:hypothetical protein C8R43DRAFT_956816 [Mycena crocata]|nr:hypothetical protein C8R43DRAFT_956816 [Mycena crocata]
MAQPTFVTRAEASALLYEGIGIQQHQFIIRDLLVRYAARPASGLKHEIDNRRTVATIEMAQWRVKWNSLILPEVRDLVVNRPPCEIQDELLYLPSDLDLETRRRLCMVKLGALEAQVRETDVADSCHEGQRIARTLAFLSNRRIEGLEAWAVYSSHIADELHHNLIPNPKASTSSRSSACLARRTAGLNNQTVWLSNQGPLARLQVSVLFLPDFHVGMLDFRNFQNSHVGAWIQAFLERQLHDLESFSVTALNSGIKLELIFEKKNHLGSFANINTPPKIRFDSQDKTRPNAESNLDADALALAPTPLDSTRIVAADEEEESRAQAGDSARLPVIARYSVQSKIDKNRDPRRNDAHGRLAHSRGTGVGFGLDAAPGSQRREFSASRHIGVESARIWSRFGYLDRGARGRRISTRKAISVFFPLRSRGSVRVDSEWDGLLDSRQIFVVSSCANPVKYKTEPPGFISGIQGKSIILSRIPALTMPSIISVNFSLTAMILLERITGYVPAVLNFALLIEFSITPSISIQTLQFKASQPTAQSPASVPPYTTAFAATFQFSSKRGLFIRFVNKRLCVPKTRDNSRNSYPISSIENPTSHGVLPASAPPSIPTFAASFRISSKRADFIVFEITDLVDWGDWDAMRGRFPAGMSLFRSQRRVRREAMNTRSGRSYFEAVAAGTWSRGDVDAGKGAAQWAALCTPPRTQNLNPAPTTRRSVGPASAPAIQDLWRDFEWPRHSRRVLAVSVHMNSAGAWYGGLGRMSESGEMTGADAGGRNACDGPYGAALTRSPSPHRTGWLACADTVEVLRGLRERNPAAAGLVLLTRQKRAVAAHLAPPHPRTRLPPRNLTGTWVFSERAPGFCLAGSGLSRISPTPSIVVHTEDQANVLRILKEAREGWGRLGYTKSDKDVRDKQWIRSKKNRAESSTYYFRVLRMRDLGTRDLETRYQCSMGCLREGFELEQTGDSPGTRRECEPPRVVRAQDGCAALGQMKRPEVEGEETTHRYASGDGHDLLGGGLAFAVLLDTPGEVLGVPDFEFEVGDVVRETFGLGRAGGVFGAAAFDINTPWGVPTVIPSCGRSEERSEASKLSVVTRNACCIASEPTMGQPGREVQDVEVEYEWRVAKLLVVNLTLPRRLVEHLTLFFVALAPATPLSLGCLKTGFKHADLNTPFKYDALNARFKRMFKYQL